MNRYVIAIPRAAIGLAAAAMTALTFSIAVVVPAALTAAHVDESAPVASTERDPLATPAVLRVEVIGTPDRTTALSTGEAVAAKSGQCT